MTVKALLEGGEVGEDDGVGVVFGLVGDGEGAAQHGGESALEFVGGGLVGGGVAGDYDLAWESGVAGGVGDGGVAKPASDPSLLAEGCEARVEGSRGDERVAFRPWMRPKNARG